MNDPVLFNCYKHHLGFICSKINKIKKNEDIFCLLKELKILGNSQMDIYSGIIEPENIISKIRSILFIEGHYEKKEYEKWLIENGNFRIIRIDDGSSWVLLYNKSNDSYIHIHPARHSLNTFRINASAFKTAIVTVIYCNISKRSFSTIELINRLRREFLELSPVKSMDTIGSIKKMIRLLKEGIKTI